MTPQEIAKRITVPVSGTGLDAETEAIWLKAVHAALGLASKQLLGPAYKQHNNAVERIAASAVLWHGRDRAKDRLGRDIVGTALLDALRAERLPQTQALYNKLRKSVTPAARVIVAYANLLCRTKQVPTVKAIQDEIRLDGKTRGERYIVPGPSGVRFILSSAELPMRKPGEREQIAVK